MALVPLQQNDACVNMLFSETFMKNLLISIKLTSFSPDTALNAVK